MVRRQQANESRLTIANRRQQADLSTNQFGWSPGVPNNNKVSSVVVVTVNGDTVLSSYILTMHSCQPTLLCLLTLATQVLHAEAKLPTPPYTK